MAIHFNGEGDIYVLNTDSQLDSNIGTKITSSKDIVVVSGTWAGGIGRQSDSDGRDIGVPIVPTDKLGTGYLVHEGYASSRRTW